jgi:hypothetical protein
LAEFLSQRSSMSFTWGTNDCASFAIAAAAAMGVDISLPVKWHTEAGAAKALKRQPLKAWFADRLGAPLESVSLAQRGDVGVIEYEGTNGPTMGVCAGSSWALVDQVGLRFVPLDAALVAWRV